MSRSGRVAAARPTSPRATSTSASSYPLVPQGISADLIATLEGFSRDDVDGFAVTSQERAAKAQAEGRFDGSLVPVYHADGSLALDHDEHLRPGTTLEALAGLVAVVREDGHDDVRGLRPVRSTRCAAQAYPQVDDDRARPPRRQLVGRRRRRRRRGAGVERLREGARADAARAGRHARGRRHRARHHADRARSGHREGARAGRHDRRRHRPVRDQRGVRVGAAEDDPRPRPRSRARSTSTAARSRSVTRSARPAPCSSRPRSTSSSAATRPPRWSRCAPAAGWAPPRSSSGSEQVAPGLVAFGRAHHGR